MLRRFQDLVHHDPVAININYRYLRLMLEHILDSVAALTPKAEIEGEMGDTHVGLQARLMSQALRKLSGQYQLHHF
jgi:RecA/RadA recombinase